MPEWLEPLISGSLTSDLDAKRDAIPANEHRGSRATAEIACIAALAGRDVDPEVTLIDPTVGCGFMLETLLRAVQGAGARVNALGVDVNRDAAEVARETLRTRTGDHEVRNENVLTDDVLPNQTAELVVYEPPWGLSWHGSEAPIARRVEDGWYPFGVGRTGDAGARQLPDDRHPEKSTNRGQSGTEDLSWLWSS